MKQQITPSIMAKSQTELTLLVKKLKGTTKALHLDIADGKCVPSKSLWFPFRVPKTFFYSAHLMIKHPLAWIKKHPKLDLYIVQAEEITNWSEYLDYTKQHNLKRAVAIPPGFNIKKLLPYLNQIQYILILTVKPGFYGAPFVPKALTTIKVLKKHNPKLKVIVDGHMNPKNIPLAKKAGGDYFISGSYVTLADDPEQAMKELKGALK